MWVRLGLLTVGKKYWPERRTLPSCSQHISLSSLRNVQRLCMTRPMASLVGMSVLGCKGSSSRAWSIFTLQPPCRSPLALHSRTQLLRASYVSCARVALTAAQPSSSSAQLEELATAEGDVPVTPPKARPAQRQFPILSPKEKKDLRAYAHSLGKKIVSQQIGKAGVTESLAKAMSDALEAKEILKLKVLDNCPDELEVVIAKIEEATQGQVVGKIGSVITLYRPSLRKLSEAGQAENRGRGGPPRRTMGRRV